MAGPEEAFRDFAADKVGPQYNLRTGRPDYDTTVVPDWNERSAPARAALH